MLKSGFNEIALRVIGAGEISTITLTSADGKIRSLSGDWRYHISAEIYSQFDEYVFPYTSFYLYNQENIDLSGRPVSFTSYPKSGAYSSLFNGMINPLIPYTIKGVIWYQGESNVSFADAYATLLPAMIADWRKKWGSGFSFYFAQIAPYFNYGGRSGYFRDVQRKSLDEVTKSGMVVTIDIAEVYDIHPSNKHDVGYRYAGLALANDYGKAGISSGPLYQNHSIQGDTILVNFENADAGLELKKHRFSEFEISGEDTVFLQATVRVVKDAIAVFSPEVNHPKFVRYAWSDTASATLFNKAGLPASTFISY